MFTEKRNPSIISATELDTYLQEGWYRMGQSIFTCHFLTMGERIYSALWLRLDLATHTFSKKQRKLFQKNQPFRYIIQPAVITNTKEKLYQKYKAHNFKGNISVSLKQYLQDAQGNNVYNTFECAIYDKHKLIAVSFFDLGNTSIASIMGIYDPAYSENSLGYYTMLLEMQYGQQKGFQYYYPGYVTPGFSRFDYKVRIGKIDYLDITSWTWKPYQQLSDETLPIEILRKKLDMLSEALTTGGVKNEIYYYPFFDIALTSYWNNNYLGYPIFLWCKIHSDYTTFIMFSYNLVTHNYVVLQCTLEHEFPPMLEPLCEPPHEDQAAFLEVLVVKTAVTLSAPPSHIAEVMMRWDVLKHHA